MDELSRDLDFTTEYGEMSLEAILAEFRVNEMLENVSGSYTVEDEGAAVGEAYAAERDYTGSFNEIDGNNFSDTYAEGGLSDAYYGDWLNSGEASPEGGGFAAQYSGAEYAEPEYQQPEYTEPGYEDDESSFMAALDAKLAAMGLDPFGAAEKKAQSAAHAGAALADDDIEIDPRFNLTGHRDGFYYNGSPLDIAPEDDYAPPTQRSEGDFISAYTEADEPYLPTVEQKEEEPPDEEEFAPEPQAREKDKKRPPRLKLGRRKKKQRVTAAPIPTEGTEDDFAEGFYDYNAEGTAYAPDGDYAAAADEAAEDDGFPGFGEYIRGQIGTFLLRLRGVPTPESSETMEEDEEDLGAEVKPEFAYKYYGSFVHSLRLRFRISLFILLIMAYISLGLPMTGMLKTTRVQAAVCLGMQLSVMLLSLDVVTGAAVNMARGRFGADSMAVLACVLTSIDALSVALGGFGSSHMPLCVLSAMSLVGVLASSLLSARGLRKALRVPSIAKSTYSVTGESGVRPDGMTIIKASRPAAGFVHRSEEAPPDEALFVRWSIPMLIAAALLALVVTAAKKSFGDILFVFTALLCPAVPVTALLCFALPYCIGSIRIFSSGAAIAGWSGLCDIGQSKNIVVTDRDLFPEGSVEIGTIRMAGSASPQKIISYAGTMMAASGAGIASCFSELMEKNGGTMRRVEDFEYLAGGGMRGMIDGESILCGGVELMRLMHVLIPYRLVSKTSVLLAVDGVLCGIFGMIYEPQPQIRKALVSLVRGNRHPIFALRDFNVTPEMLHDCFDVATDGYDFPPYVERFSISEAKPAENSKIAAVVCREGLGAFSHMATVGRSMYVATRINIMLMLLSAAIGVFAVFIKLITAGTVSIAFMLAFMLLWALPVIAVSAFMKF